MENYINWEDIWSHFDRMQQKVMADITSREEFFAESEKKRMEFYDWMMCQCGEYACYM